LVNSETFRKENEMSAIDDYKGLKVTLQESEEWAGMIGKKGHMDTGKLLEIALKSALVYFQRSPGSTNYHSAPAGLVNALEKAIVHHFSQLLDEALVDVRERTAEAAARAVNEHEALLVAAGLRGLRP
jgi:hypothetical protein